MSNPPTVSDLYETDPKWALVEATLLLAYEQKTANLIAAQEWAVKAVAAGIGKGEDFDYFISTRQEMITTRLGLGDTK